MSDVPPSYSPPSGQFTPPTEKKSGLPGWAIALIAVIGGLVVLCVVVAVIGVGMMSMLGSRVDQVFTQIETEMDELPSTTTGTSSAPLSITDAQPIGQRTELDGLEFVVLGARPLEADNSSLPPDAGMTYYTVEIEVRNASADIGILSAFSTQMQSDGEDVYGVSLFGQSNADVSSDELLQTIEKGTSTTVSYVYEVPTDATNLYWMYQDTNGDHIVYKVK